MLLPRHLRQPKISQHPFHLLTVLPRILQGSRRDQRTQTPCELSECSTKFRAQEQKGKARSSQNALRHGLNRIHHTNPCYSEEIERLASALCEGNDDPNLREQATIIAECDLIIRTARAEEIAAIEWLRDFTAVPLSRSNASLAQARALFEEIKLIGEEQSQYPAFSFQPMSTRRPSPPDPRRCSFGIRVSHVMKFRQSGWHCRSCDDTSATRAELVRKRSGRC